MQNPFHLHQTESKSVCILQTHRDLLANKHTQLDVHPNNNGDWALEQIQQQYQLPHQPCIMQQVHGANSISLNTTPPKHFWQKADACYTRQSNIICTVITADCLPVLITDEQASFVAAIHCGWRSLYAGILPKTLDKIQSRHDLIVWFGPSICARHYQVDKSFKDHYLKAHPNAEPAFSEVIDNHCQADLKTMAQVQLNQYRLKYIQDCEICTYGHHNYYSWRQSQTKARQASMIWIKSSLQASDNLG